jgi:sugar phosphate isomerase/epimerase
MLHASISEITTLRWELCREIEHLVRHGFDCIGLWRTKVSDLGTHEVRSLLQRSGIRVSSLQSAGGFTGGDGRSFRESLADARAAIAEAAFLGCPTLVIHTGCRGGHTVGHARRLVREALHDLAPLAGAEGVTLALKPFHPAVAPGCGLLGGWVETAALVEECDHPAVGLALDCWQFAADPAFRAALPHLAAALAVVQVADCTGTPCAAGERLPPGLGALPLADVVGALVAAGYEGDLEFDPVGETVECLGYDGVLGRVRRVADAWSLEAAGQRVVARPARIRAPRPTAAAVN